jgi:hypothetical protein
VTIAYFKVYAMDGRSRGNDYLMGLHQQTTRCCMKYGVDGFEKKNVSSGTCSSSTVSYNPPISASWEVMFNVANYSHGIL